ncbi:hypothetical protein MYA_4345 [Burkholderia sp. KJ006]|nr:hypothetical protein MYA_4345 [Burkholderia sp. KJ006]
MTKVRRKFRGARARFARRPSGDTVASYAKVCHTEFTNRCSRGTIRVFVADALRKTPAGCAACRKSTTCRLAGASS